MTRTARGLAPHSTVPGREWWGLGPTMWVFVLTLLGLPVVVWQTLNMHSETEALRQAESIQTIVSVVRSYYTENVIRKIQGRPGPIVATENHHDADGAIPIPATLSIELGEAISKGSTGQNYTLAFVSDMPFRNRIRPPLDQFEIDALRAFRAPAPKREILQTGQYWRHESNDDGRSFVRMAIPVQMEAVCVSCHNSHPDSPFKDWKVGDIRGIQSVSIEMNFQDQAAASLWLAIYLLILGMTGVLAMGEHKASVAKLRQVNTEKDASRLELQEKTESLESSIRELRTKTTILDRAPFGILVLETRAEEACLDDLNEAFTLATGYEAAHALGRHPRFLFGPDTDPSAIEAVNDALQNHTIKDVELLTYCRDGSQRMMQWLVFPTYSQEGSLLNMVIFLDDMTEIRDAEAERSRLVGELQESTKLEFLGLAIAGMAHDLNTPIGIAVTASSHIQQTAGKLATEAHESGHLDERQNKHLSTIRKSAELVAKNLAKAADLVRSFKRTSAEVTRNEWRTVNLNSLLNSLVLTMSPVMKQARCKVEVVCPQRVALYTEPGALAQAITNLMVNATIHAFHQRDNRRLRLEVRDQEDAVELTVTDNGNGMSEEASLKAFTPFFTTNRGSGGSGLGLFSSRRAVETVLSGKLTMATELGNGTVFHIWLPKLKHDNPNVDSDVGTIS